ncbi:uncharacterized protein ISCGN_031555 [Ixodes scapularis]
MYVAMAQTVHDLSVVVNETVYPNVTFMSVLGQLSIYGEIFKQGYGYTTTVCASATVLQVLMALSFVLGIFYHDEEVPPNKRGLMTNQSGIIMVVTCLFMWVFCAAMMLAAALFMTGGVLGYNYLCLPFYDNRLKFVDKIIGALFVPGGVKKDADPKIFEFYDTTLKPSMVLRNSCDNNMSLIKLSHMRDIKDFEMQFLVAAGTGDLVQAQTFAHWNHDAVTCGTISATWPERDSILTATMNQHLLSYMLPKVGDKLATMDSVKDYVYESLGNCKPLFSFYKSAFNAFCESNIVHLNGFWLALWLVCSLFSCIVTVALKLSKYLMRMDDYLYAGIEVEESVACDSADRTEGFSLSFAPSACDSADRTEGFSLSFAPSPPVCGRLARRATLFTAPINAVERTRSGQTSSTLTTRLRVVSPRRVLRPPSSTFEKDRDTGDEEPWHWRPPTCTVRPTPPRESQHRARSCRHAAVREARAVRGRWVRLASLRRTGPRVLPGERHAEAKQRDIFLASCGTRVFSLLLDLLKPATPHVKTLGELLATLRSHFSPAPSTLMERFRFNNRSRQDGETLGQFVAALRGLASTCAFGDQLDSLLRDRFVCGINNPAMQTRLLELPDPSLDDAVKAALAMEAAAKDASEIARAAGSPSTEAAVNKMATRSGACSRCGAAHSPSQCHELSDMGPRKRPPPTELQPRKRRRAEGEPTLPGDVKVVLEVVLEVVLDVALEAVLKVVINAILDVLLEVFLGDLPEGVLGDIADAVLNAVRDVVLTPSLTSSLMCARCWDQNDLQAASRRARQGQKLKDDVRQEHREMKCCLRHSSSRLVLLLKCHVAPPP